MPLLRPLCAAAAIALTSCASAVLIPDDQRVSITRDLEGRAFYLRGSLHVLPFFGDGARRLVSQLPPDSVELLDDTSGKPILPGPPEGLLELGTRVRIEKVEFPTSLAMARRPLYSPRPNPWVYFSVMGQPGDRPYVAVLRPGIKTRDEFLAVFGQVFVEQNPEDAVARYSSDVRAALRQKRLVRGMDGDAAKLAWGPPERIHQEYAGGIKLETWTWPLKKRSATFRDGRLSEAVPALE